ncbi:MAG TPA: hypothetical protein VGE98_04745 [Thermoanaerobaculia bacterium]
MTLKSALLAVVLNGSAAVLSAAPPPAVHSDVPPNLAKQAKVTLAAARATALARVAGGVVKSEELERECGKLIYSFDIAVPGRTGVEEVNVSALSGHVIARKHEAPQTPQPPRG